MTKYTATFRSGKTITKNSQQVKNRLDFYNWICRNRLGKIYGELESITAAPIGKNTEK